MIVNTNGTSSGNAGFYEIFVDFVVDPAKQTLSGYLASFLQSSSNSSLALFDVNNDGVPDSITMESTDALGNLVTTSGTVTVEANGMFRITISGQDTYGRIAFDTLGNAVGLYALTVNPVVTPVKDLVPSDAQIAVFTLPSKPGTWSLLDNDLNGVIDAMTQVQSYVDQNNVLQTRTSTYLLTWSDTTHYTARQVIEASVGTVFDSQGRPTTIPYRNYQGVLMKTPIVWQTKGADNVVATFTTPDNTMTGSFLDTSGDNLPDQVSFTVTTAGVSTTTVATLKGWSALSSTNTLLPMEVQTSTDPAYYFSGSVTGSSSNPVSLVVPALFTGTNTIAPVTVNLSSYQLNALQGAVGSFTLSSATKGILYDVDGNGVVDQLDVVSTSTDQNGQTITSTNSYVLTWSDTTHYTANAAYKLAFGSTYDAQGRPTTVIMNGGAQSINWMSTVTNGLLATVPSTYGNISALLTLFDTNGDGKADVFSYTEGSGSTANSAQGYLDRWVYDSSNHATAVSAVMQISSTPSDTFSGSVTGTSSSPITILLPPVNGVNTVLFQSGASMNTITGTVIGEVIDADALGLTNGALTSNDSILAGDGSDIILAGLGNDTIDGGAGNDTVNAGAGDDTVYWSGGNDLVDGGTGVDMLDLPMSGRFFSQQLDSQGVLHISTTVQQGTLQSEVDAYRVTKLAAADSFQMQKMGADGITVAESMVLNNTEAFSISDMSSWVIWQLKTQYNYGGGHGGTDIYNVIGTPWDDEISLNAASIGSLYQVFGDTGRDTLVLDMGSGYSAFSFVKQGGVYYLKGTLLSGGTTVDLGQVALGPNGVTMTIGQKSFDIPEIEAFRFVSGTVTFDATLINDAPTGQVTITGAAIEGQRLTVTNTLADVDGLGTISYQWQADGVDITGATGFSFVTGKAQVNKLITVVATYTDLYGTVEHVSSAATAPVVNVNEPTLTAFSGAVGTISEDTEVEVTFAALQASGNEADTDGTVDAFVVRDVSNGTLRIGADAASATPYNGWKNNTIDATHRAYWSPAGNLNGTMNAFAVVAKDNSGLESALPVQATVTVTPVSDAPVMLQPLVVSGAGIEYTIGGWSYSVTSADVNGDGKIDLVVANPRNNTVSVLKNNGNGAFAGKVDYAATLSPQMVTTADINGDGKVDIIAANSGSNSISILKNNGDGTFAAQVDYATESYAPSVTTADVSGDGKVDLIVANYFSSSVSVLTNNGDGTFAAKVDYATGWYPNSLISADVNGDGKADLVVANVDSNSVSVLMNNGDGTFAAKVDYATGDGPFSVVSADVSGDGKADLIVANIYIGSISVLKNNGDGTFAAKVDYSVGSYPQSVVVADVNADGKGDLVVANSANNSISVLKNNGDGTFAAKVDYPTGSSPYFVTGADVNGDGKADLIVANGNNAVLVITNTSSPAVTSFMELTPVHVSSDMVINDPDGNAGWNGGSLKVQITANAEAADSLSLAATNPGGTGIWLDTTGNKLMAGTTEIGSASAASVINGDAWSFTFNGNATNALVQDVARAVAQLAAPARIPVLRLLLPRYRRVAMKLILMAQCKRLWSKMSVTAHFA